MSTGKASRHAGIEFREEFQERLEEHREGRRAFRTELKQKGEALWQKLDRYL